MLGIFVFAFTFTLAYNEQPHAALVCRLMFSTRNLCNYMDYYSFIDPEGIEGCVGLVG